MSAVSLDKKHRIAIDNSCDCSISLSKRDILDIAFNKVIQDTATIMAGSFSNPDLFGRFTIQQLIVIGHFIESNCSSAFHNILAIQLQSTLPLFFRDKEMQVQCVVDTTSAMKCMIQSNLQDKKPILQDFLLKGIPIKYRAEISA